MADEDPFVEVGDADGMEDGDMRQVRVERKKVLLCRVGGRYYAIGGVCTHEDGMLADGELDGEVVTCPIHFGEFNVRTGEAVAPPCEVAEPVYDVKVEDGKVKVARQPRGTA